MRHGDQYFSRGDGDEGENLPIDVRSLPGVNPALRPGDNPKREHGRKKPHANLSQWREWNEFLDERVNDIGKQRQRQQNENWIYRLNLGRQEFMPENCQV